MNAKNEQDPRPNLLPDLGAAADESEKARGRSPGWTVGAFGRAGEC